MNIGIRGGRPTTADMLLAVVRMFDDLRDPARRAEILAEIESKYADLAEREKAVDARIAQKAVVDAGAEADRIVAEARAIAEQKMQAVAEAERVNAVNANNVKAERAAADQQMAAARDLADKAAADRAAAEKALAEAQRIQAVNEAKARAVAEALR